MMRRKSGEKKKERKKENHSRSSKALRLREEEEERDEAAPGEEDLEDSPFRDFLTAGELEGEEEREGEEGRLREEFSGGFSSDCSVDPSDRPRRSLLLPESCVAFSVELPSTEGHARFPGWK